MVEIVHLGVGSVQGLGRFVVRCSTFSGTLLLSIQLLYHTLLGLCSVLLLDSALLHLYSLFLYFSLSALLFLLLVLRRSVPLLSLENITTEIYCLFSF